MPNYNKIILVGHMTRDPEVRHVSDTALVCGFGLAVNENWKDKGGEKKERVTFIDCEAWNKTGEVIAQYFAKGKPILIEGKLQMDQWEDKETGQKRSKLKVNVERFEFIGGKSEDGPAPASKPITSASAVAKTAVVAPYVGAADDDIPFSPEPGYRIW